MSTLVDRFLSLGRWRWTPFVGLTAGSTTFVLALTLLVPERIGSVLAPPPRSNAQLNTNTLNPLGQAEAGPEETTTTEGVAPPAPSRAAPRVARSERRRGFSPVLRTEEPEPADNAANAGPPPDDPEAHERWRRGQEVASRAAMEAGMRAARNAPVPGNRMHLPPEQDSEPAAEEPAAVEPAVAEPAASPPEDEGAPEP